jgi:hypothetical protein
VELFGASPFEHTPSFTPPFSMAEPSSPFAPLEVTDHRIYLIRGQRVMLDFDLARLYGVTTSALGQAVRRNPLRFPEDFMFQLKPQEVADLKSQNVIASSTHGGRRSAPCAFTEHGVAMLSAVLKSERAAQVSIALVRAFVRLRQFLSTHQELSAKVAELEDRIAGHDEAVLNLFEAIKTMLADPPGPKRLIGFNRENEKTE